MYFYLQSKHITKFFYSTSSKIKSIIAFRFLPCYDGYVKNTNSLLCISPLDGRYNDCIGFLSSYFSEYALIKKRFSIEGKYLMELSRKKVIRAFSEKEKAFFYDAMENFSLKDAEAIKVNEEKYKHDIKAVEYYFREMLAKTSLKDVSHYVHFGLTSEDVNNLSYALILQEASQEAVLSRLEKLLELLQHLG